MAIKLNATYSKKLGLPGFSSHQFSVSVETELTTTDNVPAESERLYQTLQRAVDTQMQETGFVPDIGYGMNNEATVPANQEPPAPRAPRRTNGVNGNGQHQAEASAPAGRRTTTPANGNNVPWRCSDKQRTLITSLVIEHNLDRHEIDELARERFGVPVVSLNKLQASGLIDELIERTGGKARANGTRRNGGGQ